MRTARIGRKPSQFDLLPPSFHYHDRVQQLIRSWATVVCMLLATLCAVTVATSFRLHHNHRTNLRLASAAIPLMQLRRDVMQLQETTAERDQWCQWVDTAHPHDDLLQTLAAIAKASHSSDRKTVVDALHMRLPIEYPASAQQAPDWAIPFLSLSARVADEDALDDWIDKMERVDRIESMAIVENNRDASDPDEVFHRVQLTAAPQATRVLP